MTWSDLPWNPTARTLRQFAGLWICFFTALAAWHGFAHGRTTVAVTLMVLALTVGPMGLAWPALIRPVFVGSAILTFPIGFVVSRVVLAVVYYSLITPLALVFRLMQRDALRLRRADATASYWTRRPAPADLRRYFRQY